MFTNSNTINLITSTTLGVNVSLTPWDKKIKENTPLKAKWLSNDPIQKKEFYQLFLADWVSFIEALQVDKTNLINSMTKEQAVGTELLVGILELCSDADLEGLFADKRLLAISILASNKAIFDQNYERQIIRLIESTPDDQDDIDVVVTGLKGKNLYDETKNILKQLVYVNDDSFLGFGDDNYKNLVIAISNLVVRSNEFTEKANQITLDNFYNFYADFAYKTIWQRLWYNGSYTPYAKSSTSINYNTNILNFKTEFVYRYFTLTEINKPYDVFSPVWLASNKSLAMLNDISSDVTGKMVPAFVLKYLDDKGDMKTTGDVINAIVDAASLASGYGVIAKGVTGIRRVLVVTDMVGSGVSLTDNISGGYLQSQFPKVLAVMNALTIFTNALQLGKWGNTVSNTSNFNDLYSIAKNVPDAMPAVKDAENLCKSIVDAAETVTDGVTHLETINLPHLASIKKIVERIRVEADIANNSDLLKLADKALEKLRNIKFSPLSTNAINDAKTLIQNATSATSKFVDDFESVRIVAKFLDPSNATALNNITANNDMPCVNCGLGAGHSVFGGRRMDQMLEDLFDFSLRFGSKPEFITIIKANLTHTLANVREGTQHMMSTFRQQPDVFSAQLINKIEAKFDEIPDDPCTNCKFDVEMNAGVTPRYYEFKSYEYGSIINLNKQIKQFKKYLASVNDWSELRYIFRFDQERVPENIQSKWRGLVVAET